MFKTTLMIDGMMCAMCESHINDVIRNNFSVKQVTSSHTKGRTEIISEAIPDETKLKTLIGQTGYTLREVKTEEYHKKKFLIFG